MVSIFVQNFLSNTYFEEKIRKDDILVYAEDLVFNLASSLQINPIGVHLFALYHPKLNIWLCPNQKLSSLQEDLKGEDLKFDLKIRYLPDSSWDLFKRDSKAFEYYFYQIRNDFINFPREKFKNDFESEVYGIALQDELRIVMENNTKVDPSNTKKIVAKIYQHLPKNMPKHFFELLFPIKKTKIENSFMDSYYKNYNVNYVKSCYIDQYLENVASDHHYDETYHNITYYNPKFRNPTRPKAQITYQVRNQQVCIRTNDKNDIWHPLFSIKDLMTITVLEDSKIQISHAIGAPIEIVFENCLQLKSFVSLLSGYVRLSQRWNFNLCTEYFSPLIDRLRKMCCHGPVNEDFTREKLNKFCDTKNSPFIFQQRKNDFTTFYIIFQDKRSNITVELDLRKSPFEFKLPNDKKTFTTHQAMFEYVKSIRPSAWPLIPCESDLPLNLLLCRNKKDDDNIKKNNALTVVPSEQVEKSKLVSVRTQLFCIRYGNIKNDNNDKVMIKEFVSGDRVGSYLREISNWIHLQDSSIVNCKGIVLNPFSILSEFCQTSLQDLYNEHKEDLKPNILMQASYSLAKALDYIYGREFVHGFIRFENLYVSHFSEQSLLIKLGDPIGHLNLNDSAELNEQKAWLPPEYFDNVSSYFRQLTSYVDVWAFGTTLWQIFNNGQRPNFYPPHTSRVDSITISDAISKLIEQCWLNDLSKRMQPYSIVGNMSRILSANIEMPHLYEKISNYSSDSVSHSLNTDPNSHGYSNVKKVRSKEKSLFKSILTRSNMSLNISQNSGQTDPKLLTPNEDSLSVYASHNSKDLYKIEKISGNQLNSFKRIGKGCFGDVFSANLQKQYEPTTVAVKIIPETETKSLDHEIRIMTKLKHKNIVQIIGYCYIEKIFLPNDKGYTSDSDGKYKGLIMEYIELGSLDCYLKLKYEQNNRQVPLIKFATDIAAGMVFLASRSIIHRDLAARNILVKSENEVKISDFGMSHIVENDIYSMDPNRVIPIKWYAPESIKYGMFLTKSDVWSFGVLLWEIYSFCQTNPFDTIRYSGMADYLRDGNRLTKPISCPASIYAIMQDCWQYQFERRPDFESVLTQLRQLTN